MKLVWFVCAVAATMGYAAAQPLVEVPAGLEEVALAAPGEEAAGTLSLVLDPRAGGRLRNLGAARIVGFPLPGGGRVDLEIVPFDLLSPDARFFVADGAGVRETSGPEMRFFRGHVAGDPDSLVSLSLFGGRIAGFIRSGESEWEFAPRSFSPDRDGALDVRVWRAEDEPGPRDRCEGELWPLRPPRERTAAQVETALVVPEIDGNTLLKAKIAVEGTVEWTTKHGGVAGAQTYTLNLMAQVSTIYETEVKVQIAVPYLLLNSAEPDGYSGSTNSTSTMLAEMRAKWNGSAELRAVFRSATHLLSTYPSGGSGISYIDTLCDNVPPNSNSHDYAVSLLQGAAGSYEKRLVAHEIGHTFSSPHTHCYVPEIDQCYNTETGCYSGTVVQITGTIMSYCSTRNFLFHQRCKDEKIRPAAQAAFPTCIEVAGSPGDVRQQDGSPLLVAPANVCGSATLQNDDNAGNSSLGYSGTSQAAWIKRFTPACYPFRLNRVDVQINHSSVAVGRPIRVLVYKDPTGSGNPANAVLAYTQDVTVQVVSATAFNQYTLATPVVASSGDLYLGFFDLSADSTATYIMRYDTSRSGDSWYRSSSTDPSGMTAFASGTWMIRGQGGGVAAGSVQLSWGVPCNDAVVPGQDYAVYQGTIGSWSGLSSLTCTTGRATNWLIEDAPADAFWLVVPETSANEGSYGRNTSGERPPAALPCRPQAIATCG